MDSPGAQTIVEVKYSTAHSLATYTSLDGPCASRYGHMHCTIITMLPDKAT